jgi:Na+/proline symporter
MHLHWIDIAVVVIYLAAALGLGVAQAWKVRTSGDYYAGGRKFNKFYLMMHALGTASHADEPVSVIGGAYEKGLSGIWYTYLYLPLTPLFWLIAPYIRRTRFVTMADFFHARYDRKLAILYACVGVLKMSVAISVVLKGTAKIFASVSGGAINERWAILAMTVVFVAYGFAGGLRATVVTEAIQGPLIVVMSLLLLPFGLHAAGGFSALHHHLPASMFSLTAHGLEFTPAWIIAASVTALVGWVAQPGIVAAVGSGKSELEGRVGYTYGTMIKRFCAMGWVFTGVVLAALVAQNKIPAEQVHRLHDQRELAFGTAMQALLPVGFLGVMFAAILSAQMATLSAQMVNSSALASRNIYKEVIRPEASDNEVLLFGRVCGLFLVAIGVLLAFRLDKVATALTMLLGFQSVMGVIVWGGVLWRRTNVQGAWTCFIVMFAVWATLGPVGMILNGRPAPKASATQPSSAAVTAQSPDLWLPAWVGRYGSEKYLSKLMAWTLPVGVASLILGSLVTRPPPRKQVDDFRLLLKTPVGQEDKLIAAGVPVVYSGDHRPNALELRYPRCVHWGGAAIAALLCAFVLWLLYFLARLGS